jgi:predicted kinase
MKSTKRAKLYLLVGYPGSGKTTTSQIIHDRTGAVHIWADYERRAMFGEPTHSHHESRKLYDHLNRSADILLGESQSVIYDTNFNFRKDRDLLRELATKYNADTTIVWIKIDKDVARERALSRGHASDNSYLDAMTAHDFGKIIKNLEPPTEDENPIILDGTLITPAYVAHALDLPSPPKQRVAQIVNGALDRGIGRRAGRRKRGVAKP